MRFRIGSVSTEVCGKSIQLSRCSFTLGSDGIQLFDHAINAGVKPRFHSIYLFRQHLMAFNKNIKFMINRFCEHTDMTGNHTVNLLEISFIHVCLFLGLLGVRACILAFFGSLFRGEINQ